MTVITIEVISDFVCSWCFISKRNLESAIALYNKTYPSATTNDSFHITYRPYYLNHHTHPTIHFTDPRPKAEVSEYKLGHLSPEKRDALRLKMERIGKAVGVHFAWGGMIGPTEDAHRLIFMSRRYGEEEGGVQSRLVEAILSAFHENERDISNKHVLRDLAVEVGMKEEDVDEAFRSEDIKQAVDEEQEKYRAEAKGRGVPVYLIGGHRLEGARDVPEFFELILKVKEEDIATNGEGISVCI